MERNAVKDAISNGWYAAIKYPDGGTENVPITMIKNFKPKNLKDFEFGRKYTVYSDKWNSDGEIRRYKGYIVRMEESLTALKDSIIAVRPRYPILKRSDSDFVSTTADENEIKDPVEEQRVDKVSNKKKKKLSYDMEMSQVVNAHHMTIPQAAGIGSSPKIPSPLTSTILEEKVNEKQDKKSCEGCKEVLSQLKKIEEKLDLLIGQNKLYSLPVGFLSTTDTPVKETIIEASDGKINLGDGIMCTNPAWIAMENARNKVDWAVALLRGVFGEDAKLFRILPRKEGNKKFPPSFVSVAKVHYRTFLMKAGYKDSAIKEELNRLGSFLSERATDMGGRRGLGRYGAKPTIERKKEEAPEATLQYLDPKTGKLFALNPSSGQYEECDIRDL